MSANDPRPDLVRGPHDYFSDQKEPSRRQHADVAAACAELFGIPYDSRYDASAFLVRLSAALEEKAAGGAAPTLKEAW